MSHLHGCPFDLTRVDFDAAAQSWTGMFLRPLWEDPGAEHTGGWLRGSSRLPVVEGTLTLRGVAEQKINDDAGIEIYSFDELDGIPGGVRLRFCECLSIDLRLAGQIVGTYNEERLPKLVASYRHCFLAQSGPRIEQLP